MTHPQSIAVTLALLAIAITGGMFVVPLYAFLTTTVTRDQTARTVAANNVVNSAAMVAGSVVVIALTSSVGVTPDNMLFVVAGMCLIAAGSRRSCTVPATRRRRNASKDEGVEADEEGRETEREQPQILVLMFAGASDGRRRQHAAKGMPCGFVGKD